jgi:hypothetical protein
VTASLLLAATLAVHAPLALHPDNPRYFLFRGKPTVLVTSAEHYGAVLNLDFDYVRYLDALAADGLNLTRTFSGAYREIPGNFGITDNTLAPLPGRFMAPWPRSHTPGESDGGTKFDLARRDEAYFGRLVDFVAEAQKRGIVVEMNLFCPFYEQSMWDASPMNARNNVNGIGAVPREEAYSLKHADLTRVQEELARRIVTALNSFDNVYFEVANEPYIEKITIAMEWQHHMARVIAQTEAALPNRHLVSLNVANGRATVESLSPHVSIYNFHYAHPPDVVEMNAHVRGVIGENETGFRGRDDVVYRTEGWAFLLAGGGLYNNLDYSFTPKHPDGTFLGYASPGGGSPAFRKQVKVLKDFLHSFEFVRMQPRRPVVTAPVGVAVEALVESGRQYAVYLYVPIPGDKQPPPDEPRAPAPVEIGLEMPAGRYRAEWVDPRSGAVAKAEDFDHAGGRRALVSPPLREDLALSVRETTSGGRANVLGGERHVERRFPGEAPREHASPVEFRLPSAVASWSARRSRGCPRRRPIRTSSPGPASSSCRRRSGRRSRACRGS